MDAPHRRTRLDRGASLVEYSLIFSLIAVLTLGAIDYLGGELQSGITHMEAGVSTGPERVSGGSGSGSGGASGATSSTTAASIVTTTTAAPTTTTAPPTTTTTAPPTTTTTAPPTTTTTAPRPGYNGKATPTFTDTSRTKDGKDHWRSGAVIELRDQSGTPLPSGARVKIEMSTYEDGDLQDTTDLWVDVVDGRVVLDNRHRRSGSNEIDEVRYKVVDVQISAPGHAGWNGGTPTVTIEKPNSW